MGRHKKKRKQYVRIVIRNKMTKYPPTLIKILDKRKKGLRKWRI